MPLVRVEVIEAKDLPIMDRSSSDPYVVLSTSEDPEVAVQTEVKKKNLNPEWKETLDVPLKKPESTFLYVEVMDWDRFGEDDHIGNIHIKMDKMFQNVNVDTWAKLVGSSKGEIHLKLKAMDFGNPSSELGPDTDPASLLTFSGELQEERDARKKSEQKKKGKDDSMLGKVKGGMDTARSTTYSAKKTWRSMERMFK
eukprot:gb/GECH01014402.1/.p1 GENE.gb/GECH01014402.1/~~gb/GECH01014402.1/.p1  ORF type:complete len:197 (+),score=64.73 gb/GECH01014402.1/:1-591(+)